MLDILAVQTSILTLLEPLATAGATVRGLPNVPQQQGSLDTAPALIVLAAMGASPINRGSHDVRFQPISYRFVFEIRAAQLSGALGLYELLQAVRRYVAGQTVTGLGLLDFAGWDLTERNVNQNYYSAVIQFTSQVMDSP